MRHDRPERLLEQPGALPKLPGEHHPDAGEGLRDRLSHPVAQRRADLRRPLGRVLQLRTGVGPFRAHAAQERDPEVDVADELAVGTILTERDRALEALDPLVGAEERPADLRESDRRTEPEVHPRIVRTEARFRPLEERDGLAVRESLERVIAGDDQVLRGGGGVTGPLEVQGDDPGELAAAIRVERKERLGREPV